MSAGTAPPTGPGSVGVPEGKQLTEKELKTIASIKEKFGEERLATTNELTIIRFCPGLLP